MEVTATNTTASNPGVSQTDTNQSETDTSALASDFETFLKLLTTQLQNQDPSKPLDSTEFVAQLASFSSVEQQINMNNKLDKLLNTISSDVTSELAQWLGKDVKSDAKSDFSGKPIDAYYSKPDEATRSDLVIHAEDGSVVKRLPVDPTKSQISWDGTDEFQNPAPQGVYSFSLENFDGNKYLSTTPVQTFSTVVESRIVDGDVSLVFGDGTNMMASGVKAVR